MELLTAGKAAASDILKDGMADNAPADRARSVSYTHLDVYKRQPMAYPVCFRRIGSTEDVSFLKGWRVRFRSMSRIGTILCMVFCISAPGR